MQDILQQLMLGNDLSREDARLVFDRLMEGALTPAQTAALLVALRMKREAVAEIAGAAESMRRHARLIDTGGLAV
ncbi:MAG: anthranilate phosphoribosyltransferase, partial [Lentisphaerae bacterium]|nr:anthranilate phosphoribosyltransferase [Lentisphaerota bacterium]